MTVSEQIIEVLNALCEKFGIVIDWTAENVIPYIAELCMKLISWEIWTSVAWIAFMAVLSIIATVLAKRFYPTFKRGVEENIRENYYDIGWIIASVFAIIPLFAIYLATFIVLCVQVMDIIKCVTFPEMYVVEYIQNLINK